MGKLLGLQKTAYMSDTPEKYLIDAATLYKDLKYDKATGVFTGELIGATNGGTELDIEQKYRDVEVDGTYWTPVKGNKALSSTIVTLKTSIKEFTAETLRLSINGDASLVTDTDIAPLGYSQVKGKRYVEADDYIGNIACVGKISGTDRPIIVILDNCLATAGAKIKTEDDKEAEIPVEFTAHASYEQLVNDEFPYTILFPTMGGTLLDDIVIDFGNADAAKLIEGRTYQINVKPVPSEANVPEVIFATSDHGVALVDQAGNVETVGAGTCEIVAVTKDGLYSDSKTITVIAAIAATNATASPAASTSAPIVVLAGNTGQFKIGTGTGTTSAPIVQLTPTTANDYVATFTSDTDELLVDGATGIYSVKSSLSAVKTAAITVNIVNGDGTSTSAVFHFSLKPHATAFTVTPASVTLSLAGTKTQQLTVAQTPSGAAEPVTYTIATADQAKATVSASGLVTAVAVTTTPINVTVKVGTLTKTVPVTVTA